MRTFAQHIPNALTCCNLICGCTAVMAAFNGAFPMAATFIFIAVGFDFLDGLAARLLHAASPIGKDLDSLADIISFGLAPSAMLFRTFVNLSIITQAVLEESYPWILRIFSLVATLAIPVCSALRLAKFNNDPRQTSTFIGLPVPAHAIFWVSLLFSLSSMEGVNNVHAPYSFANTPLLWVATFSFLALVSSLLLVSEIPMFSLKVKSLAWKGNELRYLLLISGVILTIMLPKLLGISATILLYIILSVFGQHHAKAPQSAEDSHE